MMSNPCGAFLAPVFSYLRKNCKLHCNMERVKLQTLLSQRQLLSVRNQTPDACGVCVTDQRRFAQLAFTLRRFLVQDVTHQSAKTLDLAPTCFLEPLGGGTICFDLWHDSLVNRIFTPARPGFILTFASNTSTSQHLLRTIISPRSRSWRPAGTTIYSFF